MTIKWKKLLRIVGSVAIVTPDIIRKIRNLTKDRNEESRANSGLTPSNEEGYLFGRDR
jgi:hypothetical protein